MIDVTSKKSIKACLKGQSIQKSRQQIQEDHQNLVYRKPGASKLSPNADKEKIKFEEQVKTTKNTTDAVLDDSYQEQLTFNNVLGHRKERQTKQFDEIQVLNGFSSPFDKEMFYTPKSQRNLELNKMATNYNKHSKKRMQTAENQRQSTKILKSNRTQFYEGDKTNDPDCEVEGRAHWDTTIENGSNGSIKDNSASNSSSNISCKKQLNNRFGNGSRYTLVEEQVASTECFYCRNNKRMVEILTEKNRKLEDQYKAKKGTIKDLYDLCQYFKKENATLSLQMDKNLQIFKCKQDFFFKEREKLSSKVQNLKLEISKLNQNIKYHAMENSILVRYKDEYQLLVKEFHKIQFENQQLKHQISSSNQFHNRPTVSKSKQRQKQPQKFKPNSKQKNHTTVKHNPGVHQYKNKMASTIERKKYVHEDDDISLNLSEQSHSYH